MFGENLKAMRKAKGYTQEELAIKINVVRQTVSKWEKGLSVPDADMLSQIAEVLDTKVSVLLGETITEETDKDAVAEQLAKISEQLAIKNRRSKAIWKTIGMIVLAIMLLNILAVTLFRANTSNEFDANNSHSMIETMIEIEGSAQNK